MNSINTSGRVEALLPSYFHIKPTLQLHVSRFNIKRSRDIRQRWLVEQFIIIIAKLVLH